MEDYNLRNRIQQFELYMNSMCESDKLKWIQIKNDAHELELKFEDVIAERDDLLIEKEEFRTFPNG